MKLHAGVGRADVSGGINVMVLPGVGRALVVM